MLRLLTQKLRFMNKYFTEFIGTMFLVLVVGIAAIGGQAGAMAPIAIGTILMVMVFAGGHISGAHYNPAVTFAILIRKKISINEIIKIQFVVSGFYLILCE